MYQDETLGEDDSVGQLVRGAHALDQCECHMVLS